MPLDLLQAAPAFYVRHGTTPGLAGTTVLQILPDLGESECARMAVAVAAALSEAGGRALVASGPGALVPELQAKGGLFIPFPSRRRNPLALALAMRRLARLIETQKIDILHARSRLAGWVGYGAARLMRKPFVTTYHASYASGGAAMLRYNSVMARGDAILAESSLAATRLAAHHPMAASRIRVVPPGVDVAKFDPCSIAPSRVETLRRSWGIAPDEPIVLIASPSRLPREAGPLLDMAKELVEARADRPRVIFMPCAVEAETFVFDPQTLRPRARPRDLLRPLGLCRDRGAALLAAAVVAVPAPATGMSIRLVLEAQALGTPVVTVAPDILHESEPAPWPRDAMIETLWRVNFADPAAAAAAIRAILALGATMRGEIAVRARARVEAGFSVAKMCEETLAAYAALRAFLDDEAT
jgi:glycosyltransferase involved in cell wall biosynthesis